MWKQYIQAVRWVVATVSCMLKRSEVARGQDITVMRLVCVWRRPLKMTVLSFVCSQASCCCLSALFVSLSFVNGVWPFCINPFWQGGRSARRTISRRKNHRCTLVVWKLYVRFWCRFLIRFEMKSYTRAKIVTFRGITPRVPKICLRGLSNSALSWLVCFEPLAFSSRLCIHGIWNSVILHGSLLT